MTVYSISRRANERVYRPLSENGSKHICIKKKEAKVIPARYEARMTAQVCCFQPWWGLAMGNGIVINHQSSMSSRAKLIHRFSLVFHLFLASRTQTAHRLFIVFLAFFYASRSGVLVVQLLGAVVWLLLDNGSRWAQRSWLEI